MLGNKQGGFLLRFSLWVFFPLLSLAIGTSFLLPQLLKGGDGDHNQTIAMLGTLLQKALRDKLTQKGSVEDTRKAIGLHPSSSASTSAIDDKKEINLVAKMTKNGLEVYTGKTGDCSMRLESSPDGALVIVNHANAIGNTPVNLRGDCGSSVEVALELDNYISVERKLELKPGGLGLSIRLHRKEVAVAHDKNGKSSSRPGIDLLKKSAPELTDEDF